MKQLNLTLRTKRYCSLPTVADGANLSHGRAYGNQMFHLAGHIAPRPVFLPHDAREDELAEEKHIGPAFIVDCLERREDIVTS